MALRTLSGKHADPRKRRGAGIPTSTIVAPVIPFLNDH